MLLMPISAFRVVIRNRLICNVQNIFKRRLPACKFVN